ncbi:MAG TPA: polymer-forming cytoskeletal protein [Ignavibacteriaceae bacterium]|nr:MAG: Polymer-forming cytoskeletal [Ignavibacteria bacterium ADurb.Bin266]OQY69653.1 MAG: cell shape determination protein CcmA [Ignavibacteriales bacterium UTCHB2]HQF43427.1 polymer-forming cytoskeletal protein [Ignavibacteriaceae bacterium]HQI41631.1 polymer-forming cytoskeletal protein [Ignavibacteriaceae bacterium]HQJ46626.1 polymer-forming cytoskeletal protein [Ignavibacteriaceae bacterium]
MKTKSIGSSMEEVTIISSGVVIDGKVTSNGNVRVDGSVKGDITAQGNLTVGEHGTIQGQLTGETVSIGGKVEGTVNAKEKLVLEAKAVLKGDLITKILVVEAGAIFEGRSSMSSNSTFKPVNKGE